VWVLSLLNLAIVIGFYGISLWLPLLVKREFPGLGLIGLGFVTAIPYACAVIAMVAVGRSSDRRHERTWHLALPLATGALGLLMAAFTGSVVGMIAICVATAGIYAALGPFWTLPPAFLRGAAAAAGIAWINSIGNLGGFLGPYTLGRLADSSAGVGAGLAALAAVTFIATLLGLAVSRAVQRSARA
jgi:ACS family tartrate transporter-like MFS transporter